MVITRSSYGIKFESAFKKVVFPEPVPPLIKILYLALTNLCKTFAISVSIDETSIKVLDNTNKELQKKKASFSTIKAEKENKIIDARDEYATSISELSYKMKNVYPKLKSVQSDIISLSSGIGSEVANTGKIGIEKAQKEQKEAISQKEKDLTAAINSGATYETINTIRNELSTMKKELTNTDNAKTVLEAEKAGFLSAIAEGKRTLDKVNVELYSESVDKLTQLKELVFGLLDD